MGLTDGTKYGGIFWNDGGGNSVIKGPSVSVYNVNVGTSATTNYNLTKNVALGITTETGKSGMIVETDSELVVCIKF